jgi:hypothetical protein
MGSSGAAEGCLGSERRGLAASRALLLARQSWLLLSLLLAAFCVPRPCSSSASLPPQPQPPGPRSLRTPQMMSKAQLAATAHTTQGGDSSSSTTAAATVPPPPPPPPPLYLAVRGVVFDVRDGAGFYAPGSSYAALAGRDCSRAVALMSLEPADLEAEDDLSGLSAEEELRDLDAIFWSVYVRKYPLVGLVEGSRAIPPGKTPIAWYQPPPPHSPGGGLASQLAVVGSVVAGPLVASVWGDLSAMMSSSAGAGRCACVALDYPS